MGVIYKLTHEVINFVLEQKKVNPKLSCRKLANIVHQQLHVKLSKSSISDILKGSHMNSPVGRPTGLAPQPRQKVRKAAKKRQKFKIPEHRKPKFPQAPGSQTVVRPPKQPQKMSNLKAASISPKPKVPSLAPGLVSGDQMFDCMGCIFLKAVQWMAAGASPLGTALRANARDREDIPWEGVGDVLTFSQIFGIEDVNEISHYQDNGLWALAGIPAPLAWDRVHQEMQKVDIRDLSFNLGIDIPQVFSELNYIKLFLEEGSEVWFDAQMTSVWKKNVQLPLTAPANKVLSEMSNLILNNVQSAIFCSTSGSQILSPEFLNLNAAFENIPGKRLAKVAVYNQQHQEMADFQTIPEKRRIYITSSWPWQADFGQFLAQANQEGTSAPKPLTLSEASDLPPVGLGDRPGGEITVYFREVSSSGGAKESFPQLRVIFLSESPDASPFMAVITNAQADHLSAKEVISSYLCRWPNLGGGFNFYAVKHQLELSQLHMEEEFKKKLGPAADDQFAAKAKNSDLEDILSVLNGDLNNLKSDSYDLFGLGHTLLSWLNTYCQKYFFPSTYGRFNISSMKSICYDIPGTFESNDKRIIVRLFPADRDHHYLQDLEFAARRVNESGVCDEQGRKLVIFI